MAINRTTFSTSSLTTKTGNSTSVSTRNDYAVEQVYISDKVSGGFITFPDGSRFRKPTAYARRHVVLSPGSAQSTTGRQPDGRQDSLSSSPGGWRSDIQLTSASATFPGPVRTVQRLNSLPSAPTEMRNEAVTKALLQLADQKANIGETLATFRQTMNMLYGPAEALQKSLKSAWNDKSVRPYLAMTAAEIRRNGITKTGAKKYLEYVYGWKPLVSDIYGIIDMMKDGSGRPFLLSGTGSSNFAREVPPVTKEDISFRSTTVTGPSSERARVRCKVWGRIDPNTQGLRALNQLGLLNPVALAWELVPWSFVVDWFVPIGPVLQALTAPAGLIFVSGTTSVRTSMSGPYVHHRNSLDAIATSNSKADGSFRYEGYNRSLLTSWPLPGVWVNPTPFSGDRKWKALALAIVNLRGLRI